MALNVIKKLLFSLEQVYDWNVNTLALKVIKMFDFQIIENNFSLSRNNFNNRRYKDGYNWTRNVWGGGWNSYIGNVTAGKGATLTGLAELITGDANDWKLIARKPDVKSGQIIYVQPLLSKFELMLRVRVVSATKKFLADFGSLTVNSSEDNSRNINEYFDGNRGPASDCNGAIGILMSKGLIDSTSTYEYNLLGIDDIFAILTSRKTTLTNMLVGDSGWIQNYDDYLLEVQDNPEGDAAYQAENVIKVASDKFWGHIGENYQRSVKSSAEWEIELRKAYNKISEKKRNDRIPGHDGEAKFLNVADLAMRLFDFRKINRG
jgi:hypothetical protein